MSLHRLAVGFGFAGGTLVGWFAHVEASKRDTLPCGVSSDVLSSHYRPTPWDSNWDKRTPANLINNKYPRKDKNNNGDNNNSGADNNEDELKKVTPTATRYLFLIRHGHYNTDGRSDEEHTLTPLGREQAEFTAQRLVALGHPYTRLVHSSMTRAQETAQIFLKLLPADLPKLECDLLREGAPFPPEPPLRGWRHEFKYHEDGARIEAAFRKYFHRADPKQTSDSYEIIVCHANVIRYFVCRALQLPPEAWLRLSLSHASVTAFTIRPSGSVSIRAVGDAGHMPPHLLSVS